jgi:hypothetical protein
MLYTNKSLVSIDTRCRQKWVEGYYRTPSIL